MKPGVSCLRAPTSWGSVPEDVNAIVAYLQSLE